MKIRKKRVFIIVALVVLLGIGWWYLFMGSRITHGGSGILAGKDGTRSLIVYFSRAGEIPGTTDAVASATPNSNQAMDGSDTEAAAKMIQELTGADLYQIRTERYYRSAFWGTAATAWVEEALNLRPELVAQPENLDDYDVIYVGYPIWWFNAPMAIGSFLESYDLEGKTIVPFCTSSDNGIDVSMDYIRDISEGATVLDGYRVHNSSLEDVAEWLTRIGMLNQTDGADNSDSSPETETAAAEDNDDSASEESQTTGSKVLIAYFSVPEDVNTTDAVAGASIVVRDGEKLGNTEYVAKLIQNTVGGDLFRIETVEKYPLDHDPLVDQAADEQDANARPELATHVENFGQYEYVFLGFPNWWGDMPMAVYSFLEEYDFGAKTIIPFITHGGSGASRTVDTISELQPGALMMENELVLSRDVVEESEETVVEWANGLGINEKTELPKEGDGNTVLTTAADAHNSQTLYLWEEGNVPATTEYIQNNGNYSDDPDFRPYLVSFPVPEGTDVKGAVLICAGGAFQFRSDENEGTPVAQELASRGYQSLVVNYRLRPYTQEEGALDLARAVRFVRKNADVYGIEENDIAVMGFSAGGILAGEMLLNFDGLVNGTALDAAYIPDALDEVSADAAVDGMIYSFYGRLSVGSTDVEMLRDGNLPPTFYCYGTRDPFYKQFLANADAVEAAGVPVERLELSDRCIQRSIWQS